LVLPDDSDVHRTKDAESAISQNLVTGIGEWVLHFLHSKQITKKSTMKKIPSLSIVYWASATKRVRLEQCDLNFREK
jgi:hypothetical protein